MIDYASVLIETTIKCLIGLWVGINPISKLICDEYVTIIDQSVLRLNGICTLDTNLENTFQDLPFCTILTESSLDENNVTEVESLPPNEKEIRSKFINLYQMEIVLRLRKYSNWKTE